MSLVEFKKLSVIYLSEAGNVRPQLERYKSMHKKILGGLTLALALLVSVACSSPPSAEEAASGVGEAVTISRPSAPAGIDEDFRSDPSEIVAATGKPQLLEFFTWW